MSNIQTFQNAFAVSFPLDTANQLLGHMQALYGDAFNKKYGEIDQERMIATVCQVLDGLKPEDFNRGIQRMKSEKWCPSIPEFRTWCIQDHDWWTAEMAWAFSLNWKKDNSKPITKLAKRTLVEVSEILNSQGQRAAHKAFIETYEFNLRQAKLLNCTQVMWIKPDVTNSQDHLQKHEAEQDERNRKGIPCPPELLAKLKGSYRAAP